jgi:hypothetical protein
MARCKTWDQFTAKSGMLGFRATKLRPDQLNGADEREVTFTFRNGSGRKFTGQSLLLTFSVPQFFFHVTTAYDILRHCGVEPVKKDFLGTPDRASQD